MARKKRPSIAAPKPKTPIKPGGYQVGLFVRSELGEIEVIWEEAPDPIRRLAAKMVAHKLQIAIDDPKPAD